MGNLCCTALPGPNDVQDNQRLIDREAYNKIAALIDRSIVASNILSIIKDSIKNPDINEFNFNLQLESDYICDHPNGYGTIFDKLKENDLKYIFVKRILPHLKELTENSGFNLLISRAKINHTQSIEDGFDTRTSTMNRFIHIFTSHNSDTPGIYRSPKSKSGSQSDSDEVKENIKKVSEMLFIKVIKYDIAHQYDSDILYQTECKNYFRIKECIICYERPANVLYLGCMHLQLCDKCHSNVKDPNYDPILKGRRNCAVCALWTGYKQLDWLILDPATVERKYPIQSKSDSDLLDLDS